MGSLKDALKEKYQQAVWFRDFLLRVGEETSWIASVGSGQRAGCPEAGDQDALVRGLPEDFHVPVAHARTRWKEVCSKLAGSREETLRLQQECKVMDGEVQQHEAS